VKQKISILSLALAFLLVTNVAAGNHVETSGVEPLAIHNYLLEAISWKSIPISCLAGETLSGEFTLTSNGDLFIGDQTKYDNWLLDGIDFLILDAANYELWMDDLPVTSLYERKGMFELEWSIEIPTDGIWYIVYYNDSIFMKTVEGNIQHISQSGFSYPLLIVIMIGLPSLLTIIFMFRKKK